MAHIISKHFMLLLVSCNIGLGAYDAYNGDIETAICYFLNAFWLVAMQVMSKGFLGEIECYRESERMNCEMIISLKKRLCEACKVINELKRPQEEDTMEQHVGG